jgi:hypothetical protein
MPRIAVASYSLDEDETEFMNGLWKLLNASKYKPFGFRYHFRYEGGNWKVYIAFVNDESFRIAKENYSAIANDVKDVDNVNYAKYSNIVFLDA